ncbi:MAG: hypothetical protein LW823_08370 [Rickettsiales bacterium]|jgi:hypothetical protein|nr:hypothetical protein [Rickettsiales bacterium]
MRTLVSTPTKAALVSLLALLSFSATTANAQIAHLSAAKALAVLEEEPSVEPLVYADVTCFLFTPSITNPYVRIRQFINYNQIGFFDFGFNPSDGEPYAKWLALQRITCRAAAEDLCSRQGVQTVSIASNILTPANQVHQCSN